MFLYEYGTSYTSLFFSVVRNQDEQLQDWVLVLASRFCPPVAWGRLLSPCIDFWAWRRDTVIKKPRWPLPSADDLRGTAKWKFNGWKWARGRVSWDSTYTVSRILPWLPDYLGWSGEWGWWRLWRFTLGSPESRKWKQTFDEFVGYNNEHERKRRNERRGRKRFWERSGRRNLGKPRIKNDSESRREKAEHRKEKERKNPMKMGQGSKSWSLGVHSFILSHRESAETAYSLLLTVWENIDFERLGNCSRSRS